MNESKLIRVLTALCVDAWLINPQQHKTLTDIAVAHALGGSISQRQHALAAMMPANPAKKDYSIVSAGTVVAVDEEDETIPANCAVVQVDGVIGRKFDSVLYSSGVTSVDVLGRLLNEIKRDDSIDCCLMVFDSPGGTARGIQEAARTIRQLSAVKPVYSFIDGLCCSAAYWLASQTDAIYATESADTGSVGVYCAILDQSRAAEMQGIKVEIFKSGEFKGMGMPGTSLNDKQRQMIQDSVDALGKVFRAEVAAGRRGKKISDDDMQGQSFSSKDSVKKGFVDSITTVEVALRDVAKTAIRKQARAKNK